MSALTIRRSSHSHHAFSLIELLIVISIIVMLLGLLLPSLSRARSAANLVTDQSNLRQIAIAIFAYAQDNNGMAPLAAPQELGGPTGICDPDDPWLPPKMFGGTLPADQRPLNVYLQNEEVFRSPNDRGEPLWWFDTQPYQAGATAFELYGSSYFYASGYNRMIGVVAPMGVARFVGIDFSYAAFATSPLPLGQTLKLSYYSQSSKKILVGSIPLFRTMSGVVAPSARAQWYRNDAEHLWGNAVFVNGHVEFVRAFPYDAPYHGVNTSADPANPYY